MSVLRLFNDLVFIGGTLALKAQKQKEERFVLLLIAVLVAVICAARYGGVECVKLLLERGANVNAVDNYRCTALMCAAASGRVECVKLLLDAGADVNAVCGYGYTALVYATEHGYAEVGELLEAAGTTK